MVLFDYAHTPAAGWSDFLSQSKHLSPKGVLIQVHWGDHESVKGIRDFQNKTRLKLEKLFSLAHSLSVPLHLDFGFFDSNRSFPIWSRSLTPQAMIPSHRGEKGIEKWEYETLPSMRNAEVFEGFISFIREAASIIQLYRQPHGTICSTRFDFGLIRSDSYKLSEEMITEYFTQRFGSVEKLNSILHTSFRDFVSVASPRGLKTILMKRPWLASWEYKNLRRKSLAQWEDEIYHVFQSERLDCQMGKAKGPAGPLASTGVIFDDTLLEVSPNQASCRPLVIQGELEPSALAAFRFAEMLKLEAESKNEAIGWLSQIELDRNIPHYSFVGSKFLARNDVEKFKSYVAQGGKIFFPLGLPSWDENLNPILWGETEAAKPIRNETKKTYQIRYEEGSVSYPFTPIELAPGFLAKIEGAA